jgi:Protein of unknown function (DUF3105)
MLFIALGIAIAIAAGAVGIALAVGGSSEEGVAGPCVRQDFPVQGRQHVDELENGYEYNSTPPTSGNHYPVPAIWNVYEQPVPEIRLVHNLEHGGVVVQYGDEVPPATVQQIVDWYAEDPNGMIVAPLPGDAPARLLDKITMTAWTHLAMCTAFDEDSFSDFRDDYRGPGGDAPEKFPLEDLTPGT